MPLFTRSTPGLALPHMAPKPDALALLNEVSQRHADVKSYHI